MPGVREVIEDGVDGRLVAENRRVAMADVLQELLRDDALATRLGAAARRVALENHGRELMHQRYEALCLSNSRAS